MDSPHSKGDTDIGRLVLFSNGCRCHVEIAAEAAQISDNLVTGIQRIHVLYCFGGIRRVVNNRQFQLHSLAANLDTASLVDISDAKEIAVLDLHTTGSILTSNRHRGPDLDRRVTIR